MSVFAKLSKRNHFFLSLILLGAVTVSLLAMVLWVRFGAVREQTYAFSELAGETEGGEISLVLDRGKPWADTSKHGSAPVGAQYDWTLYNNTDAEFCDWKVSLRFPEEPLLDSLWNGDFYVQGSVITYTPTRNEVMDLSVVYPHSARTFGAVIYTTADVRPEQVVVTGSWHIEVTSLPLFWILFTVFLILLFITLLNLLLWHRTARYLRELEKDDEMVRQSMLTMTDFIDAKDSYTRGHSSRVAVYSTKLAKHLGMEENELKNLYYIALMHDCGKVGVPDAVLKKPGKLTDDEFRLIQAHATVGNHLLAHFTTIPGIQDGAHYHHERYDGSGYPDGLKGEEIPYYARIICIADAVDAMSTNRCYRDRLPEDVLISELEENAGKQFDPALVPPMIELIHEGIIDAAQKEYPNRV